MARASRLSAVGGKLKSARAKIGGACSQAMSAWKTSGMTPAIASVLGKCRSQARMRNQASNARLGGNEARAQTLEKRADRGLTMKERLARAKELRAQRQGRASSSVQEQTAAVASKPATSAPLSERDSATLKRAELRQQTIAHRLSKGTAIERAAALVNRAKARYDRQVEKVAVAKQTADDAFMKDSSVIRSLMWKANNAKRLAEQQKNQYASLHQYKYGYKHRFSHEARSPVKRYKYMKHRNVVPGLRDQADENRLRTGTMVERAQRAIALRNQRAGLAAPIMATASVASQPMAPPKPAPKFYRPPGAAGAIGGKVKIGQRPKPDVAPVAAPAPAPAPKFFRPAGQVATLNRKPIRNAPTDMQMMVRTQARLAKERESQRNELRNERKYVAEILRRSYRSIKEDVAAKRLSAASPGDRIVNADARKLLRETTADLKKNPGMRYRDLKQDIRKQAALVRSPLLPNVHERAKLEAMLLALRGTSSARSKAIAESVAKQKRFIQEVKQNAGVDINWWNNTPEQEAQGLRHFRRKFFRGPSALRPR